MNTTFSIITPAYNSEKFIEKAMDSVINVKYNLSLIEHIIIDDGSTDKTQEIVESYAKKYSHIRYYKKNNNNWGSVINFAIEKKVINNDCVLILDSDDCVLKNCFNVVGKLIKDNDMVITSFNLWNGKKMTFPVTPYFFIFKKRFTTKKIMSPISLPVISYFRKDLFYSARKLEEGVSYQDTILICDLIKKAKSIQSTWKVCANYWHKRPGATMTELKKEKSITTFVNIAKTMAEMECESLVFFHILTNKNLRARLKKDKIKMICKNKPNFKWVPIIVRWIFYFLYIAWIKNYFYITK